VDGDIDTVDVQVCMNSGKVRLNSGILERRHSNWDEALHHFRRAREIDDTYCEPDYWIGASLLQQGKHVQLGLMVGRALLCFWFCIMQLLPNQC